MSETAADSTKLPSVLEQIKEVKSEAAELRNFTITFLSLLLYINLIIAGTDAEQILRIAPVTLPLLNVPLPIIGFYGFLPWLLLFFHLYLLVQHYLFSQQLFRFDSALQDASPQEQAYISKNLGNLPFLHWMVGKHSFVMHFVLTLITLVCLIVWPLVTLLWLQMAILPFHGETLIEWQRAAIVLDVLMVGWLWPKTLARDDSSLAWWKMGGYGVVCSLISVKNGLLWPICHLPGLRGRLGAGVSNWQAVKSDLSRTLNISALALGLLASLFLSLAVATLPDSWEERFITLDVNSKTPKPNDSFWLKTVDVDEGGNTIRMAFVPTARLHEQHARLFEEKDRQEYDELVAKGAKPCPTSKKPDDNNKSGSGAEQTPSVADSHQETKSGGAATPSENAEKLCLMAQPSLPRNLILREKVLTADTGLKPELEVRLQAGAADAKSEDLAQIRGLDLQNRNLDYADFTQASLPKADLRYASLKHAVLSQARLDQVQLQSAHLDHADLSGAELPGANLSYAELPGANLFSAQLPGANLSDAQLPGADLPYAELPGANLSGAQLPGADLSDAQLPGADLSRAELSGALLQVDASPLADEQLTQASAQYRQAVTLRPNYLNRRQQLNDLVKIFEEKIRRPSDFSGVGELKPCLREDDAEALLGACMNKYAIDDNSRKALADIWLGLACGDKTKGYWIAQRMVERAESYTWFAKRLQQATKNPKTCPGLTGLPEDYKVRLQALPTQND